MKERESLPSTLTTSVILSSSSGQISGQFVNPKYTRLHFPSRSFSVNGTPLWVVNSNGPPTAAFPHLRFSSSFSALFVRKGSIVMRLVQERNSSAPGVSVFRDQSRSKELRRWVQRRQQLLEWTLPQPSCVEGRFESADSENLNIVSCSKGVSGNVSRVSFVVVWRCEWHLGTGYACKCFWQWEGILASHGVLIFLI